MCHASTGKLSKLFLLEKKSAQSCLVFLLRSREASLHATIYLHANKIREINAFYDASPFKDLRNEINARTTSEA